MLITYGFRMNRFSCGSCLFSVWPRCRAHCWRSAVQAGLGWSPLYREAPVEDPSKLHTICCVLLFVVSLRFLRSLLCQFILEAWVSFVPEVFVLRCPRASTCLSPTCGRIVATHGRCPGEVAAIPLQCGAQLVWVCCRLRDAASLCCF